MMYVRILETGEIKELITLQWVSPVAEDSNFIWDEVGQIYVCPAECFDYWDDVLQYADEVEAMAYAIGFDSYAALMAAYLQIDPEPDLEPSSLWGNLYSFLSDEMSRLGMSECEE